MNRNPLSSKGELDSISFFITVLILVGVASILGFAIRGPLDSARVAYDIPRIQIIYFAWFIASIAVFWMMTTAFLKRWTAIEDEELPKGARAFIRFLLLSPLLSIWFTFFTMLFSIPALAEGQLPRKTKLTLAVLSLVLFHFVYMGFRVAVGDLVVTKGMTLRLASGADPSESLTRVLKNVSALKSEQRWIPGRKFYVHVFPYLNPTSKLGLSLYSDFMRTKTLYNAVTKNGSEICEENSEFMGVEVSDCFFRHYLQLGELRPFSSPTFAFLFETKYRQSLMGPAPPVKGDPFKPFAENALMVSNILTLLEPTMYSKGRREALHPLGFLPYIASPELPAVDFGQDAQRHVLITRVLPQIKPPLKQLEKALSSSDGQEPESNRLPMLEVKKLFARIKRLEQDPLGIKVD